MDCERFDKVVLDWLYDELDELTSAAAKRHMDQCSRCREIGSGLRATRDVGVLPLLEPPEGLSDRILAAERNARAGLPLRQRAGRAVSIMAGYAMRPQLAMAATLLLMIGGSLLLLRAKPGDRDSVQVTERGVPQSEAETVVMLPEPRADEQAEPRAAPPPPARAARARKAEAPAPVPADDSREEEKQAIAEVPGGAASVTDSGTDGPDPEYQAALESYRDGRYSDAVRRFDSIAQRGGPKAPSASLLAAQASRISSGCKVAAPRFEKVNTRYGGSGVAHEATWQAADCYRVMGQMDRARRSYESLLAIAGYGERAKRALASLGAPSQAPIASKSAATPKKAKAKAKPKAEPDQAAPPPAAAPPTAPGKSTEGL